MYDANLSGDYAAQFSAAADGLLGRLSAQDQEIMRLKAELATQQIKIKNLSQLTKKVEEESALKQMKGERAGLLTDKNDENDALKKDLDDKTKSLEDMQRQLDNAKDSNRSLRLSAHLITPGPNAKIPKNTIPCFNCAALYRACNNTPICDNCCASGQVYCHMAHSDNGWITSKVTQPKW
ncbi:hypothetical protein CC78DRAFT_545265 [Lojkania enalia]|uniref:Uncharacterized protein n=1 Tax=Lojkania enalia TaxID=147567 RepID=A0A9P4MYW7_9PLEO|nr:hypothetical protein CC78DRAFT_545265 [Didymosphaeria enalia]